MPRLNTFLFCLMLLCILNPQSAICQEQENARPVKLWDQRFYLGVSAGYPVVPFVNLGVVFNEKIYADAFVEPVYSRVHASYFTLGYQQNTLFNTRIAGQLGLSYMEIPGNISSQKISTAGMNMKILAPLSKSFSMYMSAFAAYPDHRIKAGGYVNVNIGVNFYINEFPNLAFWAK